MNLLKLENIDSENEVFIYSTHRMSCSPNAHPCDVCVIELFMSSASSLQSELAFYSFLASSNRSNDLS